MNRLLPHRVSSYGFLTSCLTFPRGFFFHMTQYKGMSQKLPTPPHPLQMLYMVAGEIKKYGLYLGKPYTELRTNS